MTLRLQLKRIGLTSLSLGFLTSCTPAYNQKFAMSFLPPAPRNAVQWTPLADSGPKVEPNLYLSDSASFLKITSRSTSASTQVDVRIRRAEERFQEGKRLYAKGDRENARARFDDAIDILLGTPEAAADRTKVDRKLEELV